MTKRILGIFVAVLMVMALIPMSALAAENAKTNANTGRTSYVAPADDFEPPAEGCSRVILTVGDVWGDGTGYQMLLDADANAYGSVIPTSGALTTGGDVSDAVYAEFEYKIPENADGALDTTNIVLNDTVAIEIPAGVYDWCITNPTPNDRMWIASGEGNVGGRYDDYTFEDGYTYEFVVSHNEASGHDQTNVTVLDPNGEGPDLGDLDAALNVEGGRLHFDTTESFPWQVIFDGNNAYAKSGNAGVQNSESSIITVVEAVAGDTISFNFMAWGEGSYSYWDHCDFYVNESRELYYGALDNDWEPFSYTFPEDGLYTLTWSYTKDGSVNPTGDYFAVDEVETTATPVGGDDTIYIDEIYIYGFVAPEWGEHPVFDLYAPEDCGYYVSEAIWYYGYEYGGAVFGGQMTEDDVFDNPDAEYSMGINLLCDEGYDWADQVVVYINDGTELVLEHSAALFSEDYCVTTISFTVEEPDLIPITEVYVNNFYTPIEGESPFDHLDLTVPEDAHYSFYEEVNWWNDTIDLPVYDPEETFVAGYYYSQGVTLVADEGYYFAVDCVVYANGETSLVSTDYTYVDPDDDTIMYVWDNPILCEAAGLWGDANGDGVVDSADALLIMRYSLGIEELDPENLAWCDVDGSGAWDFTDALLILRKVMGVIDAFPVEN